MRANLRAPIILLAIALAFLFGLAVVLLPRGCAPVPPPVAIAPPSVTPVPPTSTPIPPTATPTLAPTFTPVPPTSTPAPPTATLAPTSTPTMWDTDTRGDTPVPAVKPVMPPVAPDTGGDPGDGVDILSGVLGLLIVAVAGGAVSQILALSKRWREWKPDPRVKMTAVLVLTSVIGGGLVWLQTYALPQYWQFLPVSVRTFIVAVALFGISQTYYKSQPAKADPAPEEIPVATRLRS